MKKVLKYLWKNKKGILLIFLLGLFLRLLGTFPGYPLTHPDEPTIGTPSIRMVFEGNFRPQSYYYGSLLSLIYAATYVIFFIPLSFIFFLPGNLDLLANGLPGFFDFLEKGAPLHKQTLWSISYWARYDSAVLSSLTVIAVYLLGKQLFNKPIALVAAFFVAINYRHVLSSRLILADAPAALFATLALLFFTAIIKRSSVRNYFIAGIAIALALSVKYFVYVIPTFFLCHILAAIKNTKLRQLPQKFFVIFNYKVIFAIATAAAAFIVINPYFLLAREEAAYYLAANSARYGLRLSPDVLTVNNLSYYSLYYLYHYGIGPMLSIFTIAGFLVTSVRHPRSTLIIASIVLPFLYTFLVISGTGMVRNYAAIIPLILFFPAVLIYETSIFIQKYIKRTQLLLIICLVGIVGYQSLVQSLISGYNLAKEQNMISLYWWLDSNLQEGNQILGPSGIFYPAGRNFESVRFYLEGNNFPAMEDIQKTKVNFIISSNVPADVTENILLNKEVAKRVFFNKELLEELSLTNYTTLAFKELADYRIAQFVKPFTQDPPYLVAQFPSFWKIAEDEELVKFSFDNLQEFENWTYTSQVVNSYQYFYSQDEGMQKSGATKIIQNTPHCTSLYSKFSSELFNIESQNWYSLVAWGKRETSPNYHSNRNGFFRLDFYDVNNNLVKTSVTSPLTINSSWQKLTAAGMSPQNTAFAQVSFQIDSCLPGEQYFLDNLGVFVAKQKPEINKTKYPFYSNDTNPFEWMPQL